MTYRFFGPNLATNQKTSWKFILVVLIIAVIVGGGVLSYLSRFSREIISLSQFPEIKKPEKVVKDETADWKNYRNEEYGFEVKYPKNWSLSSWALTIPRNPGYIISMENGDKKVGISITANFPDLPDFNPNAPLSQEFIGGMQAHEETFIQRGCCNALGCSGPFIGLWTEYNNNFLTLVFKNTTEIDEIYSRILSTFRFLE